MEHPVVLVTREDDLRAAVARLARAQRVAIDIESNGLFKYRATLCTLQLADADQPLSEASPAVVVDTLTAPLGALAALLGADGPRKIVHDVAFDARILAESGVPLANVLDTSIAARMVGRTATGLASLLASELGIQMDKRLQHHDWTERPLGVVHLRYLANDVAHLGALADKIGVEAAALGIDDAVDEETRYRVLQAQAASKVVDPRPAYLRLKGVDRVPKEELPLLRHLAQVREDKASQLDVPPYKVVGPDVLFAIAKAKPSNMGDLEKVKGATNGHRARSLARQLLDAVARGLADGGIPDEDRALLERPRPPPAMLRARRARESRLTSWRKAAAKARGVDEQVVLPGHCLQDLADLSADATLETIASVPGIGAFRSARDGASLLALLSDPVPVPDLAAEPEPEGDP